MKKFYVMGMVLAVAASFAFAGSLNVPWFVDNAPARSMNPPTVVGTTVGIVFLHNNAATETECLIKYYNQEGLSLGPVAPAQTTFVIPANSTIAFRPVADDPTTEAAPNGWESAVAAAVPNRPTDLDTKKNGSIVIAWEGDASLVQGMVTQTTHVGGQTNTTGAATTVNSGKVTAWGTLLPSGF